MNRSRASRALKFLGLGLVLFTLWASSAAAADPDPEVDSELSVASTETEASESENWPAGSDAWLVFRTGIRHGAAFRIVNTVVERGRWIQADLGYYDSGDAGEYRLFWAGAGGAAVARDDVRLELKAALARSFGTTTAGELHLLANATLSARPLARWKLEISHTEGMPLNAVAERTRTLDRARLEHELGDYQLGLGYAGTQSGDGPWQHRPFVSVSKVVGSVGEVELWLQRVELSDGPTERIQLRFSRKLKP